MLTRATDIAAAAVGLLFGWWLYGVVHRWICRLSLRLQERFK